MRVQLSNQRFALVEINYGRKETPVGTVRTTELSITTPCGHTFHASCACHSNDQFKRRIGRHITLINIFNQDTKLAEQEAGDSLDVTVSSFYKINRVDRAILFRFICSHFFRKTPEQIYQRELAEFNRIGQKYGLIPKVKPTPIASQQFENIPFVPCGPYN